MASFDLFRNPFVLLDLELSASAKQVAEAFEDAVAEGNSSETELAAARQALLRPVLRLDAELGSLLDTPQREWRPILTALKRPQSLRELWKSLTNVPPLSRSNILAHIASRIPADPSMLTAWVNAQNGIKPDIVYLEIEQFRKIAASSNQIVGHYRLRLTSLKNTKRGHSLMLSQVHPTQSML